MCETTSSYPDSLALQHARARSCAHTAYTGVHTRTYPDTERVKGGVQRKTGGGCAEQNEEGTEKGRGGKRGGSQRTEERKRWREGAEEIARQYGENGADE